MHVKKIITVACLLFSFLLVTNCFAELIVDKDGKRIEFSHPFTRIISLYGAHTRNLVDMGAGEQIVAVGRSDKQMPDLPSLGFREDVERFLVLKPDLVIIRPMISRAVPRLIKQLEQNGVVVVSLQPNNMDDMFSYWLDLAKLSGHDRQAEEMIDSFKKKTAEFQLKVDKIPMDKRLKVYFEAIHKRMKTFTSGSMPIFVLEQAGGINIASDAIQVRKSNIAEYGKERILSKADEIDVFLAQKGRMNPITIDMIKNEPGFQVIKAVRDNRVYLIDERLVSRPTMGLLQAMEQIHNMLYGDEK